MVCLCCCCDPHKLAYISGIITAVEAFGYSVLNILLICISNCSLVLPDMGVALNNFFGWYFIDNSTKCNTDWLSGIEEYPTSGRLDQTTPDANLNYQIVYLVLHVLWFFSCFVMMYGNAKKRWGFYVPWLLITLTLLIMDVVVASFYIQEFTAFPEDLNWEDVFALPVLGMVLSLYLRGVAFWLINLVEFGTVMNAFCKSYHKRSKQERQQKKRDKEGQKKNFHQEASMAGHRAAASFPPPAASAPPPSGYPQAGPSYGQEFARQPERVYDNPAFNMDHPPVYPNQPPPPPRSPQRVPSELRPFSYLNPGFRPTHPHDVDGMRIGGSSQSGYMSDDGGAKRSPPTSPPPYAYDAPPPAAQPRQHDSLKGLPSFPQQPPRPTPQYSSLRSRPVGPQQDPRPPSDYAEPWDQKAHPTQLEQLSILPRVNLKVAPAPPRAGYGPSPNKDVFY